MPVPARKGSWDFTLMMLTVAALGALGVQSFVGTLYAWWAYRTQPAWEATGHPAFVDAMNTVAAPFVIALVVLLGLCVPKRVLVRRALAAVSLAMLAAGGFAWLATGDPVMGLAVYLVGASAFQTVVLGLTVVGSPRLDYLTEGRLVRVGSGLLHLGFLLFAYVIVALQTSVWMLPVFWMSAVLLTGGSALSFYARPLARGRKTAPTVL